MASSGRLQEKAVIITGGASGLGAAQARLFISEGASVIIADVDEAAGSRLAEEFGPVATFARLDVREANRWDEVVATCTEKYGSVDGLVNNAGILAAHSVETASEEDYRRVIDINQIGTFLGMKAVVPQMRTSGGGSIVNVSSLAGSRGFPGIISYVASKWAVRGMTRAAALELAADNIRVNSIHPGRIETPMIAGQDLEAAAREVPVGRLGTPANVASLVLFLISDESSYITGAEHAIDGGAAA
jgi:3alpha(or 20beta)-hydroxysteroid dehydrogenase